MLLRCLLAGQFYHGIDFEVTEPLQSPNAIMYVKGHTLNVTRWNNLTHCTTHVWRAFPLCLVMLKTISSTGTGRRTSANKWQMGRFFPAGLLAIMERAWLMENPQTTSCHRFLTQFSKLRVCVCVFPKLRVCLSQKITPFRTKTALLLFHRTVMITTSVFDYR